MPQSSALRRTFTASLPLSLPAKKPPILDPPKPISETVIPVLPNSLDFMRGSGVLQIVRKARRGARRKRHDGQGWVFFTGGRKTGGIANQNVRRAIHTIPGIDDTVLWLCMHPGRSAKVC